MSNDSNRRKVFVEKVELAGISEGKRAKQHRIDDAENGGVGSDSEGERENRHGGKAGILQEHSECVANRSEELKGSRRSSTALTTLKMAVLVPIPRASVRIATAEKPGFFRNIRSA